MIVVDKADMESLGQKDVEKLLRWCAAELLRRDGSDGIYQIEEQIAKALLNHFDESETWYLDMGLV